MRAPFGVLAVAVALVVAGGVAAWWLWPGRPASGVDVMAVQPDDVLFGRRDAPVRVVAYVSLTCEPCGAFHRAVVPHLKAEWLDTGRAQLVYREFPGNESGLAVAAFARCMVGSRRDRAPDFLDLFFRRQADWLAQRDPIQGLSRVARDIDRTGFDRLCLDNPMVEDTILRNRDAARQHGVKSTPTFFIDGRKHVGALTWAELDKRLKTPARAD